MLDSHDCILRLTFTLHISLTLQYTFSIRPFDVSCACTFTRVAEHVWGHFKLKLELLS